MIFRARARKAPEALAVLEPHRAFRYREMAEAVDRTAARLSREGVSSGDAVLVALENRAEFFVAEQAIEELGGFAVTVSPHLRPTELAAVLADARVHAAFAERDAAAEIARLAPEVTRLGPELAGTAPESALAPLAHAPSRGGTILYTSGTTGAPRALRRAAGHATARALLRFAAETPMARPSRHLVSTPLYHATAQAFSNLTFLLGGAVVLLEAFTAQAFFAAVERHQVAHAALVPTLLRRLVASAPDRGPSPLLKALFSISAPLSPSLATEVRAAFGPVLYNVYGATELGLVTLATPEDLSRAPGTLGRPLPGVDVRLVDQGREVDRGQVGELFVRVAGATREAPWRTAGDLAYEGPEGRLFCVGRTSDVIVTGGVKVFPAEVEQALSEHAEVREAAVVGVPDEEWGEVVVAFVVLRADDASARRRVDVAADAPRLAADLAALCRDRLSPPKRPKALHFVEELPRNALGKVLRRELRARL